ncbi:MAG: hypothetical protein ACTSPG_05725 [Candidatus Hodarchaeales archaeon]
MNSWSLLQVDKRTNMERLEGVSYVLSLIDKDSSILSEQHIRKISHIHSEGINNKYRNVDEKF